MRKLQEGKEIEEAVTGDQWPATGEEQESGLYWIGTRHWAQAE